jgi:hypothetical protein
MNEPRLDAFDVENIAQDEENDDAGKIEAGASSMTIQTTLKMKRNIKMKTRSESIRVDPSQP